jgi:hypothetical protein
MKFTDVHAVDNACCCLSFGKTDLVLSDISNTWMCMSTKWPSQLMQRSANTCRFDVTPGKRNSSRDGTEMKTIV